MYLTARCNEPADDLACLIDLIGITGSAAEGAQVGHHTPFPHEGMKLTACRSGLADDLARLINRSGATSSAAEGAQVGHNKRSRTGRAGMGKAKEHTQYDQNRCHAGFILNGR